MKISRNSLSLNYPSIKSFVQTCVCKVLRALYSESSETLFLFIKDITSIYFYNCSVLGKDENLKYKKNEVQK